MFLCLTLPNFLFNFYVFGKLVTFPDLEEVAFSRKRPMDPSSALPSGHRAICCRDNTYIGCVGPSVVDNLVGIAGPQSGWFPDLTLCRGCQPLVGKVRS